MHGVRFTTERASLRPLYAVVPSRLSALPAAFLPAAFLYADQCS
jgi:hypothetical protein